MKDQQQQNNFLREEIHFKTFIFIFFAIQTFIPNVNKPNEKNLNDFDFYAAKTMVNNAHVVLVQRIKSENNFVVSFLLTTAVQF